MDDEKLDEAEMKRRELAEQHAGHVVKCYQNVCRTEAPYPINSLPDSGNPDHRILGAMIGMMIKKGLLKL